jgi:hypothetical protein
VGDPGEVCASPVFEAILEMPLNTQELPQNLSAKYPEIWLGNRSPLDATWTGEAVNFALFSENAAAVDLCPL